MASSDQSVSSHIVLRTDSDNSSVSIEYETNSTRNLESTSLVVSLPSDHLPPVEQVLASDQSYSEFLNADPEKYPPTVQVPLEEADGMLGRSSKVYATDETASIERLQSPESMGDPPQDINMHNLGPPRPEADKATQEDALNTTLHQVSGPLHTFLTCE